MGIMIVVRDEDGTRMIDKMRWELQVRQDCLLRPRDETDGTILKKTSCIIG